MLAETGGEAARHWGRGAVIAGLKKRTGVAEQEPALNRTRMQHSLQARYGTSACCPQVKKKLQKRNIDIRGGDGRGEGIRVFLPLSVPQRERTSGSFRENGLAGEGHADRCVRTSVRPSMDPGKTRNRK